MRRILFTFTALAALASFNAAPARAQDAAELIVRLGRIEAQMRQMSGQIEQLQFQNQKLEEELTRFRKDTDMRFDDAGKASPGLRPSASTPAAPQQRPAAGAPLQVAPPAAGGRRGDAFDPNANPGAPGVPRTLGTTQPTPPLAARAGQTTIDTIIDDDEAGGTPGQRQAGAPLDLARPQNGTQGGAAPPIGVSPPNQTRADFDAAMAMLQRSEYAGAEMAFRQFLQSHPRSPLASDATYWLGESYFQRNLHRDAAEQYLKVSTNWPQSARAADSMLKLGMSLTALGARDQACSTYREVDRKYPNASQSVKRGVEREFKRARCAA